jgi:hypothetical protein
LTRQQYGRLAFFFRSGYIAGYPATRSGGQLSFGVRRRYALTVNQNHLCEIERSLGFTYPASFHSLIREFTTLSSAPGSKQSFPTATLLLSTADIIAERERMDARERLGVAGVPLPVEVVERSGLSSRTLVPFLRDEGLQLPDTYAFDLESDGPEYSVVVWSYADPMIVHDWDGFMTYYHWLCEHVATNEHRNA